MPFNSLLLPLVGGFLFISFWNKTKYNAKRSNGQRLILESALWGTLLFGVAYGIVRYLSWMYPAVYSIWHYLMPYPQLGAPIGSLLIGACLPFILNVFWDEKEQNTKSYTGFSDYFGLLFFRAQLKKKPVMITLRNGKVYIGLIHGCNTPGKHDGGGSIYIQPALSGYRRHVSHEMHITTDYTAVLQSITVNIEKERLKHDETLQIINSKQLANKEKDYLMQPKEKLKTELKQLREKEKTHRKQLSEKEKAAEARLNDLKLAVSVSDIVSAVVFDKSVYGQFNPMSKS